MCVYAHISGGAGEALVFPVRNVLIALRVDVLLGQPKVNNVGDGLIGGAIATQEEVLWLHIPVYQVLTVHILDSCYLEVRREGGREGGRGGVKLVYEGTVHLTTITPTILTIQYTPVTAGCLTLRIRNGGLKKAF